MAAKARSAAAGSSKWKGCGCVWLAACICCGAAAGKKRKPTAEDLARELERAPATARSWRNAYGGQAEAALAGKKLFDRHCANCHGTDAQGTEKAPDLHGSVVQNAPPGVLFWFLKNGNLRQGMPSWSRLPDPQLWQLVTYLKTLSGDEGNADSGRPGRSAVPDKPPVKQ